MAKLILLIVFIIFLVNFAYGYGIGVSPNKIEFGSYEQRLFILNSNLDYVFYNVIGCEPIDLELHRNGVIDPKSSREIIIRLNPLYNGNIRECDLELSISNNFFSIGFDIPVKIKNIYELNENRKEISNVKDNDSNINSYFVQKALWIILAILGLIISVFLIWKFL